GLPVAWRASEAAARCSQYEHYATHASLRTAPKWIWAPSVIQEFLGEERRAGASTFQHHDRPYSDCTPPRSPLRTFSVTGPTNSTRRLTLPLKQFSDTDTYFENNEFLIRIGRRGGAWTAHTAR